MELFLKFKKGCSIFTLIFSGRFCFLVLLKIRIKSGQKRRARIGELERVLTSP